MAFTNAEGFITPVRCPTNLVYFDDYDTYLSVDDTSQPLPIGASDEDVVLREFGYIPSCLLDPNTFGESVDGEVHTFDNMITEAELFRMYYNLAEFSIAGIGSVAVGRNPFRFSDNTGDLDEYYSKSSVGYPNDYFLSDPVYHSPIERICLGSYGEKKYYNLKEYEKDGRRLYNVDYDLAIFDPVFLRIYSYTRDGSLIYRGIPHPISAYSHRRRGRESVDYTITSGSVFIFGLQARSVANLGTSQWETSQWQNSLAFEVATGEPAMVSGVSGFSIPVVDFPNTNFISPSSASLTFWEYET